MRRDLQKFAICLWIAAIAVVCGGCAGSQQVTVLHTVGPAPSVAKVRMRTLGNLVVYTAVEVPPISSDTLFYPHTAYAINDSHGAFLRGVRNHIGSWDEQPERVSLPPGRYLISAESELQGDVKVPIIIRPAKTTVVNLQRISQGGEVAWSGE
jgi:hypothetical protein